MAATENKRMTLDEVKASFREDQWCSFDVQTSSGTVTVAFRKPTFRVYNEVMTKTLMQDKAPHAALPVQMWMVKECLLTHTPAEFDQLLEEQPGLFSAAAQGVTALISTGVSETKKG